MNHGAFHHLERHLSQLMRLRVRIPQKLRTVADGVDRCFVPHIGGRCACAMLKWALRFLLAPISRALWAGHCGVLRVYAGEGYGGKESE